MAALAAAVGYAAYLATGPADVPPNCDKAELVLSTTELQGGGLVRFRLTGPAGRYVVAVDAAALRVDSAGRYRVEPRPGAPEGFRPISDPVRAEGCRGSGMVGLDATIGERVLTLFRLDGPGAPTALDSKTVTVTEDR